MTAVHATIASHPFDLTHEQVVQAMKGRPAESLRTHYVVVGGRRYPPKQVIAAVTGLDRSAFISTQARSVLQRLGFTVGRVGAKPRPAEQSRPQASSAAAEERLAHEAAMLRPFIGDFVAVDAGWTEVIASGPDPFAVKRALDVLGRRGAIFQVPEHPEHDIGSFDW